jgi:hypothetical protein
MAAVKQQNIASPSRFTTIMFKHYQSLSLDPKMAVGQNVTMGWLEFG